jgi:NAD-dependent SIR2 family protein deacetylase
LAALQNRVTSAVFNTTDDNAARLAAWLAEHARVTIITGAGVSTASGIPDYRDAQGRWKRHKPIQHSEFVNSAAARRRYWARSMIGWRHVDAAKPNAAHRACAALERVGRVHAIVTQNVDGLHEQAGSRRVIDLHGRLDKIQCLDCGKTVTRAAFQRRLEDENPDWDARIARIAPDGDADLEAADYADFRVPGCRACGGTLKPTVVFYGGTLSPEMREAAAKAAASADALLVVGSSLTVWSAFSLVRDAARRRIPVVAVNHGRTRADDLLAFKCEGECGATLAAASNALTR